MHIDVAIEEYLACKKNRWTHDTYRWCSWMLHCFEQWCKARECVELAQITPIMVHQFVAAKPSLSGNTKHHKAQVVKGFLRWCSDDEDSGVKTKTLRRIEMPKVEQTAIEIYSEVEIKRLLAACEKTRYVLRNRAIILLLLDTGVRAAELCLDSERPEEETGLKLEHVVLGKSEAGSYITVMGKGRKTRTVKVGNVARMALTDYIKHERPRTNSQHLFIAKGNKSLTARGLENFLKRLGESAKVKNTHPHRFRHTFAINQLLARTNSLVLMHLLGHSSLESTKMYTRALSQMQARQASASVVDELWKDGAPALDMSARKGRKETRRCKEEKASETVIAPQQELVDVSFLRRKIAATKSSAQWIALFRTWQERRPPKPITTSQVAKLFSDVLPDGLHQKEGEHPLAFLYRLRTAMEEHVGVTYGDMPFVLHCQPAIKRGMNLWQVYQVPPAR